MIHITENRITVDPAICNGKPIIRGMRITAQTVLEFLSVGETHEEILKQYPMLEAEDITACLDFASRLIATNIASKKSPNGEQ